MTERKAVRLVLMDQLAVQLAAHMMASRYTLAEALEEAAWGMDPEGRWDGPIPPTPGPVRIEFPEVSAYLAMLVEMKAHRSGLLTCQGWERVVLAWCDRITVEQARAA